MNLKEEKKLWKRKYRFVVGLDEAGRGPLAGPVVAAAVMIRPENRKAKKSLVRIQGKNKQGSNFAIKQLSNLGVKDSKKLTPKKREKLYEVLTNHPLVEWGTGRVGPKLIDRINILEATKLAMKRAVKNLETKLQKKMCPNFRDRENLDEFQKKVKNKIKIDFLIIDGNFRIYMSIPQKSIIKADQKVFSCQAASIISKVTRDRAMERYHKKYPQYSFAKHKGYPTKYHCKMLKKFGPCKIHRKSFGPVRESLKVKT